MSDVAGRYDNGVTRLKVIECAYMGTAPWDGRTCDGCGSNIRRGVFALVTNSDTLAPALQTRERCACAISTDD